MFQKAQSGHTDRECVFLIQPHMVRMFKSVFYQLPISLLLIFAPLCAPLGHSDQMAWLFVQYWDI